MILDVLKELSQKSTFSKKTLAIKLNTSEAMIEQVLDQLKRMKYVASGEDNPICSGGCSGCTIACATSPVNTITITEKGRKLLSSI